MSSTLALCCSTCILVAPACYEPQTSRPVQVDAVLWTGRWVTAVPFVGPTKGTALGMSCCWQGRLRSNMVRPPVRKHREIALGPGLMWLS